MRRTSKLTAVLVATCALLHALTLRAEAGQAGDVCGAVISVECHTDTGRVQLVISSPALSQPERVEITANAATEGLAAEEQYLFKPVCAVKADGTAPSTVTITGVATEPPDSPWRAARLCDPSITPPRLVRSVQPVPPPEVIAHNKLGTVWLELLLGATGRVEDVRVTHSVDREYGGDASAVATAKQWAFSPASRNGQAISVVVPLLITFAVSQ